jgi:hypothetical protein
VSSACAAQVVAGPCSDVDRIAASHADEERSRKALPDRTEGNTNVYVASPGPQSPAAVTTAFTNCLSTASTRRPDGRLDLEETRDPVCHSLLRAAHTNRFEY